MFNTNTNSTTIAVAIALATVMLLGAFAAPAAAVSGATVTPTDDGTGASTTHTVSFDDDTDAGDIDELTIDYEATDVSDVTAGDATVTWAGVDQTVSSVEAVDDTTLTIALDSPYTLDDAASESVDVDLAGVENPENAGDYSVDVTLTDTTAGTDLGPATGTFTVTVGATPSVTATSELADDTTVAYESDDTLGDLVEVESNSDNLELRVYDDDAAIYSTTDVETVTAATDTEPGTYEFNVTQGAYSGAEIDVNETENVTIAVENLDGDDAINMFDVELDNQGTTSQAHVSTNELTNPTVFDVSSETVEPGFVQQTLFDAENETTYEVSSERTIDGDNSVVSLSVSDDDFAGDLADAADERDDGAVVNGMALAHDEDVSLVSLDEPAEHVDTDEDTFAVYYAEEDRVNLYLGDEYADANSVEVTLANMPATDIEAAEIGDVADAYAGSELGIRSLSDDLGWMDAFRVADSPFSFEIPSLNWGPFGDDDENSFVIAQAGV